MIKPDNETAYKLIETGALVNFDIIKKSIQDTADNKNLYITVDLQLTDEEGNPTQESVEWGAFGFIFVVAILSFADARPRGLSGSEYDKDDNFTIDNLFDCLQFKNGDIYFYADYISGRCMKTKIVVTQDGLVSISTTNRGETLLRWLDKLKGKKALHVVT